MLVDSMLRDMRELAEKHHEVTEDYDRAIASWDRPDRILITLLGFGLPRPESGLINARTAKTDG